MKQTKQKIKSKEKPDTLRQSIARYRLLFKNMINGFAFHKVLFDDSGRPCDYVFLEVNDAFERMTGLRREDIIGKKVTDVLPDIENDPADLIGTYGRVALTGQAIQFENYSVALKKWFSVSAYSPEKGYFASIFADVTDRKLVEEALRISDERLKRSQKIAHLGSWELDFVNNHLSWSDEVYRIFGLQIQEFGATYEAFLDAVHPDDRATVDEAYSGSLREGRDVYEIEHRIVRKSTGEVRFVHEKCEHIRDESGRIIRSIGIVQDITEHKRVKEALKAERKRLHDVLEAVPIMVCLLTPDYHVAFANLAFRDKFGESHGRRCYEYFFGKKEPCDFCETYGVLKTGKPHHWQVTTPDGASVIDVYDFPFTDVDGSPMILEIDIDITERKRLEEKLNKYTKHLETLVKKRTEELSKAYREFEAFFNRSITPLVFLDRDFNFIRVNDAYAIACQRDISDFTGHNHFELYPHKENETIFREVVETKIPYQAIAKPFSFPDHPEWGITYWDWTPTPILGENGEVDFLVFALKDVTERKKAEDELRRNEEKYRSLIEQAPDGIVILDKWLNIVDVNPTVCQISGFSREELLGVNIKNLILLEDLTAKPLKIDSLFAGETILDERRIFCKDGSLIDVEASAKMLEDGNIKVIARDIAERNVNPATCLLPTSSHYLRRRSREKNILMRLYS